MIEFFSVSYSHKTIFLYFSFPLLHLGYKIVKTIVKFIDLKVYGRVFVHKDNEWLLKSIGFTLVYY